jgi:predicted dehydrogenase
MADDTNTVSRRDFIKTATASGVVAATTLVGAEPRPAPVVRSTATARVIGANDRIRVGIVGVKTMGGGHLRNLVGPDMKNDNVEVVAVCDLWESIRLKAQKTAQLSDAGVYTDYRRLLDNKDVDAVVVATPDHWHGRIGLDALLAAKHLYIEKPMTRRLDEAFRIYDAAKETGLRVQVGSQGCSDPKFLRARDLIKQGSVGQLLWAQGSYCRNNPKGEWNYPIDAEATAQTVDWKTWLGSAPKRDWSPERFFRWRKYWDYGTGIIGDLWPHRLHPLMLAMNLNEFPKSVTCIGSDMCHADAQFGPDGAAFGERRDVPDTTMMMVEFPSGVSIVLAGSTVNERGLEDVIRGTKANLTMGGNRLQVVPERPYVDEVEGRDETPPDAGETHVKHMRNFLQSIRTNTAPNCSEDLAIRVQTVVSMAEAALRKQKLVRFDERKREIVA